MRGPNLGAVSIGLGLQNDLALDFSGSLDVSLTHFHMISALDVSDTLAAQLAAGTGADICRIGGGHPAHGRSDRQTAACGR